MLCPYQSYGSLLYSPCGKKVTDRITVLFGLGVNSLASGNLFTVFATLVLAALGSQGFRQLIRPKELT